MVSLPVLSADLPGDDDVLALRDRRAPDLRDDDAVDARAHRPRCEIEPVEIVQVADGGAALDALATAQDRLVVTGEWRYRETRAIDHLDHALRAVGVVADRLDLAVELAVVDGGGRHAVAAETHARRTDGAAPAELAADRDLAQ